MKELVKFFVISMFIFIGMQVANSQPISGTKTIPGDYATLTAALTELNTNGVGTGGVTFNIAAGYKEYNADSLKLTATGTAANQIIFQKDPATTGANPLITRTDTGALITSAVYANGDAIITLEGSDYVTFDGINISASDSKIEYGYYIRKVSGDDACKYVNIKNCTVTMTKGTPINRFGVGIFISNNIITTRANNGSGVTVTSEGGRHENIVITGDSVRNTYISIVQRGYAHSSSPYNFYDQNITIGDEGAGNVLHNYAGTNLQASAINTRNSNNVNISYNDINNIADGGTAFGSYGYGIMLSGAKASNITVSYNTISLNGGPSGIYGISVGAGDSSGTVNIHHNTIKDCSGSTASSTPSVFNAIKNGASQYELNIYSNIINNITLNNNSASIINIGAPRTANVYDNIISNIIIKYSKTANSMITIDSLGIMNVYGNTISNISNTSDTAANGNIIGINVASGTNNNIYKNKISGLYGRIQSIYGISVQSGTTNYIYNNVISDLKSTAISNEDAVRGISITSTDTNTAVGVYYNTIYLDASSSGMDFGTTCIFHTYNTTATTSALDMRNNIFVNNSTQNGTGKTVAFRRSDAGDLNNIVLSNNNCFYAGTPGANKLIFSDGTNNFQTIAEYKAFVTPRDSVSFSENPPFVNITAIPYNLHLKDTLSQCRDGGLPITSPISILVDYDNVPRDPLTPDVGAYELFVSKVNNNVTMVSSYRLEQNYPNPFNPFTNIRYQIANNSFVLLKIFDVLGREVAILVNEKQFAGTYVATFNASQYPSGVYFYTLKAGNFAETKKMMLIK
jgi:trimeric autotransporter adhesin